MTFRAQIQQGKLMLNHTSFARYIATLPEGRWVEVSVEPVKRTRSNEANRFYWGVVVAMIAEHIGYQKEEVHRALGERFLRDRESEVNGVPRVKSTTKLSPVEMFEYTDQCRRWAAEFLGLYIPDPNEECGPYVPDEKPEDRPNVIGTTDADVEKIVAAASAKKTAG